jgi:biopolymer transport protein ExbD
MQNFSTRRARRQAAAVNLTPLIDVLLILVAVLMLALPLFVKRLPVDLPRTALAGTPTPLISLSVSISADGGLMVGGERTPLKDLQAKVTRQTTLELAIDKDVRYETMATVVAALQTAGPKEIVLLTR